MSTIAISSLTGCGGSGGSGTGDGEVPPVVIWPGDNSPVQASFLDTDGKPDVIAGHIDTRPLPALTGGGRYTLYWVDTNVQKVIGNALSSLAVSSFNTSNRISLTTPRDIPNDNAKLLLVASNMEDQAIAGNFVAFRDFTGSLAISGPGGTPQQRWVYGQSRPYLHASESVINGRRHCRLDNGLVMVIDSQNDIDDRAEHSLNDALYPAFSFDCSQSLVNDERPVYLFDDAIEDELVTYSALNDAFFYGTVTYNFFHHYLGRPPIDEKLRLRVHYGNDFQSAIFWSGDYANFGDQRYISFGSTGLDTIAHELAHGFLEKNTPLQSSDEDFDGNARTLHEAFADIVGTAAKHFYSGELNWLHGEEIDSPYQRDNSKIITEAGAVPSYFDYDENSDNRYLGIGLITYPFYLLTQQWGMERSFPVFLDAAQSCWQLKMDLPAAAQCVLTSASNRNEPSQDVISAFKAVKIKLFDQGVLAHFDTSAKKRTLSFSDSSIGTSQITQWHWEFGDGNQSTDPNPQHTYNQGGDYHPVLTVTDIDGDTDSFTRPISVFTDYCAPIAGNLSYIINSVTVDGQTIDTGADLTRHDYSDAILSISNPDEISINIDGEKNSNNSYYWKIWLDANDDGEFDNSFNSNEIVYESDVSGNTAFNLSTSLQLPTERTRGTLRLRITGQFAIPSPCNLRSESTVDLLINER